MKFEVTKMRTLLLVPFRRQTTFVLILLLLAPFGWSQGLTDTGKRDIDIATINLYVGADFTPVLTLDPEDPAYGAKLIAGVATIYSRIRQTDFETRADALARQIVGRGPDLVALQEVTQIRRQSPGDSIVGGKIPAMLPDLDYLELLMVALQRHGGHYEVASYVNDVDVELPLLTPEGIFDDLRLTDRDVILVRTDLPPGHLRTSNPGSGNFEARLPLPIDDVTVLRGWCSIDVESRGRHFRFINTHLEDGLPPPLPNIQLGQAVELLLGPARTSLPVVLAGDFNSDAFAGYSPETYSLLTNQGGFTDLWSVVGGRSPGLTWGHDQFLSDVTVPFVLRLDLILMRGPGFEAEEGVVVDPVIGTAPPLWFSDHGGVFGKIRIH
jgi:endonuclease/exonuclease/phosphatase family metal-dependent hydrolase